jgi:hypothetical protein
MNNNHWAVKAFLHDDTTRYCALGELVRLSEARTPAPWYSVFTRWFHDLKYRFSVAYDAFKNPDGGW